MVQPNQDHHAEDVNPSYLPEDLKIRQYVKGGVDLMVQSLFLVLQDKQSYVDSNIPFPYDRDELHVLLVESFYHIQRSITSASLNTRDNSCHSIVSMVSCLVKNFWLYFVVYMVWKYGFIVAWRNPSSTR